METAAQSLEFKSLAEDGSFEGIAAAYGNVDAHGDRIEQGAFKSAEGLEIPLLFAHKTDQPIGVATVVDTPSGLMVKGKLLLDTVAGSEAYARLKAGVLKALSVGFQLPKNGSSIIGGVRVISSAVLKEISLVVFPANALAAVTTVKHSERSPLSGLTKWLALLSVAFVGSTLSQAQTAGRYQMTPSNSYYDGVLHGYPNSRKYPGGTVTVCDPDNPGSSVTAHCTNKITIYSDPAMTHPTANPFTLDANGSSPVFYEDRVNALASVLDSGGTFASNEVLFSARFQFGTGPATIAQGSDPRIVNAVQAAMPGSPTAVYRLTETSGTILDSSGNGNDISGYTGGAAQTAQGLVFSAAGQQVATPVTGTYQSAQVCFTHQLGPEYVTNPATDMSAYFEPLPVLIGTTNQTSSTYLAGASVQGGYVQPAVVNPSGGYLAQAAQAINGGPHCVLHVRDASADKIYYDGVLQSLGTTGGSSASTMAGNTVIGGTFSGATASTSNWFWGTVHSVVLWPSALTPRQVQAATAWANNDLALKGLPAAGTTPASLSDQVSRLIITGNSISACAGNGTSSCWNTQLSLINAQLSANIVRNALGGTTATFMEASQPYRARPYMSNNGSINVELLWDGINDGCRIGKTVDQQWSEQIAHARKSRALGWKVIIGTMIDDGASATCGGGLTPTQYKHAYNALVLANWSQFFDNVADFGSSTVVGVDGASASSTNFYSDHVHPIGAASAASIASIASAAINAVSSNTVTTASASTTATSANHQFAINGGNTAATMQSQLILNAPNNDQYNDGQAEAVFQTQGPVGSKNWVIAASPAGTLTVQRFSDDFSTVSNYFQCFNGGCIASPFGISPGAPASATAGSFAGQLAEDANYFYVSTAAGSWKAIPLAPFPNAGPVLAQGSATGTGAAAPVLDTGRILSDQSFRVNFSTGASPTTGFLFFATFATPYPTGKSPGCLAQPSDSNSASIATSIFPDSNNTLFALQAVTPLPPNKTFGVNVSCPRN